MTAGEKECTPSVKNEARCDYCGTMCVVRDEELYDLDGERLHLPKICREYVFTIMQSYKRERDELRMGQEKDINFPSTPAELTHPRALPRVTVIYFKPSGKYYTEDTNVEWPRDPTHHTGWAPLEALHRIKKMYAVCIENPHGFPQFSSPRER